MRILAFDTATRATAVALSDSAGGGLEARDDPPAGQRPRHTTRLIELIVGLLERAELGWEDLDRIAVGIGPGTFTGLRIGIATARALSSASGVPLVGVSTLSSLALGALSAPARGEAEVVAAVLDARRAEVFAAAWQAGGRETGLPPAQIIPSGAFAPEELAARVGELRLRSLVVGEGAVEFRQVFESAGAVVPEQHSALHTVTALSHCRLAADMHAGPPDDVHPEYLRLPDAEIARRSAR